jgi:hypothetical protein
VEVGLVEDVASRDGIVASMQDVSLKQFLFLRNLAGPLIDRLSMDELWLFSTGHSGIMANGEARTSA